MDCWAIIPAKPFHSDNPRLATLLGVDARAALSRRLFGRVLDAALGTFPTDRILVVTKDELLLALMRGQGLHALEDGDGGVNPALALGCRHATERGAPATVGLAAPQPPAPSPRGAARRRWCCCPPPAPPSSGRPWRRCAPPSPSGQAA